MGEMRPSRGQSSEPELLMKLVPDPLTILSYACV